MKHYSLLPLALLSNLAVSTAFSFPATPSARVVQHRPIRTHASAIATASRRRGVGGLKLDMSSVAGGEEEGGEASPPGDVDDKIEGRKRRVVAGYGAALAAYLAAGAASLARGGATFPVARVLAAFVAMPAGVSYVMIGAARNDRLGSDTYKRLNLALGLYGLVGLGVCALGGNPMLVPPFALSAINSAKGYAYGALGWDKKSSDTSLLRDVVNMFRDMNKGFLFTVPTNAKAFVYFAATALVSSLKLLKLFEIVKFIQSNSFTSGLAPLLARFNRLLFFSLVLYTLKDAAERDRLGGTTFIQLNYLSALSMGINYAFYSGAYPEIVGAVSAAFAAFFAFTGVSSYMKKQKA